MSYRFQSRSFASLDRFTPRYFILFDIITWDCFLNFSFSFFFHCECVVMQQISVYQFYILLLLLSHFSHVRPHRRQSTRLPRPWDSPGKNSAVGCHFLLQCMKVKSKSEVAQSCLTSQPHGLQPTRLLRPWDFPGKSTGVGCHCLLRLHS